MKLRLTIFYGSVAAILSACGPGAGASNGPNAFTFSAIGDGVDSFTDLTEAAVAEAPTTVGNLPEGGGFVYDGLMSVGLDNGTADGVLGTVRLNVDFDDSSFSGNAGSFRNFLDETTDGALSISNGTIAASGDAIGTAQVSGSIDFEAGPMTLDEIYVHTFTGDDGEYNIGAALSGEAQPAVGPAIPIISSWVVQRQ